MESERYDHEALDPRIDPVRWERVVASIGAAAAPELARRTASAGTLLVLSRWMRPVVATAAALVALCSATLAATAVSGPSEAAEARAVAEALVPSSLAAWLEGGEAPNVEDLLTALEPGEG